MRRSLATCASAAVLLVSACARPPVRLPPPHAASWRPVEEVQCAFRVEMPAPPTHRTERKEGADVYQRNDIWDAGLGGGHGYVVSCLREPGEELSRKSPEAILDEMGKRNTGGGAYQVVDRRPLTAGACRASEEKARIEGPQVVIDVTTRLYVAGDRAFVVLGTAPDQPPGDAYVRRFLDSFHAVACDARP